MLTQALVFLCETFFGLFSIALLVRFYLQVMRAPARNQVSQFVVALTDFVVRPVRRVIPGFRGLDIATLILAWATELLLLLTVMTLKGYPFGAEIGMAGIGLALLACLNVFRMSLYILIGALIVQSVLSWTSPQSPLAPVFNSLVRPFLRPLQRRVPPVGNVDLSPLLLVVACQLALMLPVRWLEGVITSML